MLGIGVSDPQYAEGCTPYGGQEKQGDKGEQDLRFRCPTHRAVNCVFQRHGYPYMRSSLSFTELNQY